MIDAKSFLTVMRKMVEQQTDTMSSDVVCEIESVNEDGTLNIYVLPDRETVVRNVINESRYNFRRGDNALLYKIHNKLSDSFIIAKFRPSLMDDPSSAQASTQNVTTTVAGSTVVVGGASVLSFQSNIPTNPSVWLEDSNGFHIAVAVEGIRESDAPIVDIDIDQELSQGVVAQQEDWAKIYKITAGSNGLRIYATSIPDLVLRIKIMVVR